MTRFFRIEYEGRPRHVVARDQGWRLLEGDLFGDRVTISVEGVGELTNPVTARA